MVQFSIISVLALVDGRLHEGDKADPPPLPAGPDQTTVDHGSPGRKLHHGYGGYDNNYPQQNHSFQQQHAGPYSFVSNSMNRRNLNSDLCMPNGVPYCLNGGKCNVIGRMPQCLCQFGYRGAKCSLRSQTCKEEPEPLAAVFVVDESSSLGQIMYSGMLEAVCEYIEVLQSKYSDYKESLWIGVVSFSVKAEKKYDVQKWSKREITCEEFQKTLKRRKNYDSTNYQTNYDKAFTTAKDLLRRATDISSDARLEIILFTDGQPTDFYAPMFKADQEGLYTYIVPNGGNGGNPPLLPPSDKHLVETMLNKFKEDKLKIGISAIYVGPTILKDQDLNSILGLLTKVAGCNGNQKVIGVDLQVYRGVYETGELCPMLYVAGGNTDSVFEEVKSQAASILYVQKQCSHCQLTELTADGELQITCRNGTKCAKDPKCCSELGGAARCNSQFPYLVEEDDINLKATCKHSLEDEELVNPCPKIEIPETTTGPRNRPCHPRKNINHDGHDGHDGL